MKQEQLIKLARELTEANYCFGFDWFVECYDVAEWEEFLEDTQVSTKEELISALNDQAESWSETQADRECFYVCETGKCDAENTRDNPKEYCDCNFYPAPDPEDLHWQKEERRLNHFQPIPIKGI
jgi:hypothetical protein